MKNHIFHLFGEQKCRLFAVSFQHTKIEKIKKSQNFNAVGKTICSTLKG